MQKGSGKRAASQILTFLLLIIVAAWLLFSDAPTCPSSVLPQAAPPASSLKHSSLFFKISGKDKETSHHQEVFKLTFSLQDAEAALETADYINLAPGQTWAGEISIIWHWPRLVTLPDQELGWEILIEIQNSNVQKYNSSTNLWIRNIITIKVPQNPLPLKDVEKLPFETVIFATSRLDHLPSPLMHLLLNQSQSYQWLRSIPPPNTS